MLKSMKKLKLWSRKKKRKLKTHHQHSPPPPSRAPPSPPPPAPQIQHLSWSYSRFEPSAPPLPPSEYLYYYAAAAAEDTPLLSELQEWPPLPDQSESESGSACQQYTEAPGPVCGIPVPQRESFGGKDSGLLKFWIGLISCFLPCYRIS